MSLPPPSMQDDHHVATNTTPAKRTAKSTSSGRPSRATTTTTAAKSSSSKRSSAKVVAAAAATNIPSLDTLASGAFLNGTRAAIGLDDDGNDMSPAISSTNASSNVAAIQEESASTIVSMDVDDDDNARPYSIPHYTHIDQASQAYQSTFVLNDASNRHRYRSNLVSHCMNYVVGKTKYPLQSPYACMMCHQHFDSVPFMYVRGQWDPKLGVFKQVRGNFCSAGCMLVYIPLYHPYEWRYMKTATVAFVRQELGVDISRISAAPSTSRLAKLGGNLSAEEYQVPCAEISSTVMIDDTRWTPGVTFFQIDTLNSERATRARALIDRLHPEWTDEAKARTIRDSLPMHVTAHPDDATIVWHEPTQSFIDVNMLAYYQRQMTNHANNGNEVAVEPEPQPSHAINAYAVVHPPPQVYFTSNLFMLPAYEPGQSLLNAGC